MKDTPETTFHNVTITIATGDAKAAYALLCDALASIENHALCEWQTTRYSVSTTPLRLRPVSELYPQDEPAPVPGPTLRTVRDEAPTWREEPFTLGPSLTDPVATLATALSAPPLRQPDAELGHVLRCLMDSPRFQQMTVADAIAELRANGVLS